ncbi:hypothetical protein [Pseudoduganella violaceinigra]|uniref:hypothetical protein n=1 Tax=Pseudoduganella violaceinigra TaxID=246602 RepID=UPI000482F9FF|nr:hypothetical protein [Pseudoduganella violaceinigra]
MNKLYAGIAVLCMLATSNLMAKEGDAWKAAYTFPHFTAEYAACGNFALNEMKKLLQEQGVPASEWAGILASYHKDLRAREVIRPFVNGESLLIGLNMRWLATGPACQNPVLSCQDIDKGVCAEVAHVPNDRVVAPFFANEQIIIAESDKFRPSNLNPDHAGFVFSKDKGKSWAKLNTPVSCDELGGLCRLIPQTASRFILASSKLAHDKWTDVAIHATSDGGQSWSLLTGEWAGIQDINGISAEGDTIVGLPNQPGEFVVLSRFRPGDKKTEEFKTTIRTDAWNPRYDARILNFGAGYLVRLNAVDGSIPPRNFGLFFVSSLGDATPAKLIWQSNGVSIGALQTSQTVIAIQTWDPKSRIVHGNFAEQIHYSLDAGKTWKVQDVPLELRGALMRLGERKVWLFTPTAVKYLDLN